MYSRYVYFRHTDTDDGTRSLHLYFQMTQIYPLSFQRPKPRCRNLSLSLKFGILLVPMMHSRLSSLEVVMEKLKAAQSCKTVLDQTSGAITFN